MIANIPIVNLEKFCRKSADNFVAVRVKKCAHRVSKEKNCHWIAIKEWKTWNVIIMAVLQGNWSQHQSDRNYNKWPELESGGAAQRSASDLSQSVRRTAREGPRIPTEDTVKDNVVLVRQPIARTDPNSSVIACDDLRTNHCRHWVDISCATLTVPDRRGLASEWWLTHSHGFTRFHCHLWDNKTEVEVKQ